MAKKEEKNEIENEEEILEDEIIELIDENGKAVQFYHIATIDYKEDWYVFFTPAEEMEEVSEEEVVIFKLGSDNEGNDVFLPIEDEKLLQDVYDEYVKMMEEEAEGEDCGCCCEDEECKECNEKEIKKAPDCGCGCNDKDCGAQTKDKKKK